VHTVISPEKKLLQKTLNINTLFFFIFYMAPSLQKQLRVGVLKFPIGDHIAYLIL